MKTVKRNTHVRSKIKAVTKTPVLSTALEEEFLRFAEYHPARRFSRNLRSMLLEFLMHDGTLEAFYLKDLLYDLEGLFELLEVIQAEGEIKT